MQTSKYCLNIIEVKLMQLCSEAFYVTTIKKRSTHCNGSKYVDVQVQCDRIGRFLKVLGNKFSYNSSPNFWCLFYLAISKMKLFK